MRRAIPLIAVLTLTTPARAELDVGSFVAGATVLTGWGLSLIPQTQGWIGVRTIAWRDALGVSSSAGFVLRRRFAFEFGMTETMHRFNAATGIRNDLFWAAGRLRMLHLHAPGARVAVTLDLRAGAIVPHFRSGLGMELGFGLRASYLDVVFVALEPGTTLGAGRGIDPNMALSVGLSLGTLFCRLLCDEPPAPGGPPTTPVF